MTNALVVKAANLIRNGDIAGAEFALVSLAETEGDYALVAALDTLPPKDLLAVIREYDTSKESVVNLLVTPEQFARAVVMERLYGDHSHVRLRGMVNAVLFRDDTQTGEFIEAIGEVDGGCEALIDYLSDRDEEVVHFVTYDTFNVNRTEEGDEVDKSEISDRDWKELTWLLKHEHADMFEQIWPVLKKRMKERLRREAELELAEQKMLEPQERPVAAAIAAPAAAAAVDPDEESAL
ncbi:hypothetical protein [Collimonas sp.]|jgi:hypothetical protein|uniref:hypothetical protein n=1 Tax=Collimonas sp. TaxID=1963772 RepID=UPI002B72988A|nr:hypothetical protein [Collimonas sp.]HWW05777.1 hypothetical protein [Collimonas sp.]